MLSQLVVSYEGKDCFVTVDKFKYLTKKFEINDKNYIEMDFIGNGTELAQEVTHMYYRIENDGTELIVTPMDNKIAQKSYNDLAGSDKSVKVFEKKGSDGKGVSSFTVNAVDNESDMGNWTKVLSDNTNFSKFTLSIVPVKMKIP